MLFEAAFPFQDDVLSLPVADVDEAATWYAARFGMVEVERRSAPHPAVTLERDGVRIGFAVNGGDPTQDGAAIRVSDLERTIAELQAQGLEIGNRRIDYRDGRRLDVFFVAAPDGLCFYFHQVLAD